MVSSSSVAIGDLVYLYCDRNKSRGRDRYLITPIDGAWCQVRKFVGSQLRSTTYRFKKAECYKVRMDPSPSPCHITRVVPTSTTMTRMIPPCLQPHHHRYLQLLPHPHLSCTGPPKMVYLHPPRHRCLLFFLLLLLIPIQILILHPYRLPATSKARTSCPNDPHALGALHNT